MAESGAAVSIQSQRSGRQERRSSLGSASGGLAVRRSTLGKGSIAQELGQRTQRRTSLGHHNPAIRWMDNPVSAEKNFASTSRPKRRGSIGRDETVSRILDCKISPVGSPHNEERGLQKPALPAVSLEGTFNTVASVHDVMPKMPRRRS